MKNVRQKTPYKNVVHEQSDPSKSSVPTRWNRINNVMDKKDFLADQIVCNLHEMALLNPFCVFNPAVYVLMNISNFYQLRISGLLCRIQLTLHNISKEVEGYLLNKHKFGLPVNHPYFYLFGVFIDNYTAG